MKPDSERNFISATTDTVLEGSDGDLDLFSHLVTS